MALVPSSVNDFYMSPNAIAFALNALGDKDTLSVSVYANARLTAFRREIIPYNPDNNYRQWTITAYNTHFDDDVSRYAHMAVSRTGDFSYVVYPRTKLDLFGRSMTDDGQSYINDKGVVCHPNEDGEYTDPDGNVVQLPEEDPEYWYMYMGKLSGSDTGYRRWLDEPAYGNLDTDQYRNEEKGGAWAKMFQLNEITNTITQLLPFARLIIGTAKKVVTDIWRSTDKGEPSGEAADTTVPTYAAVEKMTAGKFLSKVHDDEAAGRIAFGKGWQSKDAIDSFLAGRGTLLSEDGERIQTDQLEVRRSMKVMELIINRLRAMSSDFVFDETRKVEKVELIGYEQGHDGTKPGDELYGIYKLTLDKDTDYDFHAFHEGDIVYQIVNTLPLGGSDYHTGYYHIASVDTSDNSITVFLYHEDELDGTGNFVPMAEFNIAHRGNVNGADVERLSQWLLSSSEGRITFLDNLTQPTIHQRNYAAYIGKFLNTLDYGRDLPIRDNDTVVFARHLLAENLYMVDFNGEVVTQQPERGEWSYETAISDRPYRCVYTDEVEHVEDLPDKRHTLLTQDKVTHLGSTWICLKDKTTQEPWVDSPDWQCVNGNNTVAIEIHSSAGQMFRNGDVETELYAVLFYNGIDITEKVLGMALRSLTWTRDTGIAADDAAWNTGHETTRSGLGVRIVQDSSRFDLGPRFFSERRAARFTFSVELPVNGSDGSVRYSETVTVK